MTELTVVKDNPYQGEKSAPPQLNWGVRERCWDEGALAQFVADQEKLPAIKQEVAQEIFEEIAKYSWNVDPEAHGKHISPIAINYEDWQSLKQRMGVK